MTGYIIQGVAAAYLLLVCAMANVADNFQSKLFFRFAPFVLGALSLAHAYAQFMGWTNV